MNKLAELKSHISEKLPLLTADKIHLFIVNGGLKDGYLDYTARLLFLDCRINPISILSVIKTWLQDNNLHRDAANNEISLNFSSEIIDTQTFDLEVDFPQREKINIKDNDYSTCKDWVWDDQKGFIQK
jgi:hypothetical protein